MRFDAALMALVIFFLGIIGSYGSVTTFEVMPVSNASTADFNPEQQHFSIPIEKENIVLATEEKDAEEEDDDEIKNILIVNHANITAINAARKILDTQKLIFLSLPKLKRYILFHALKLDC